MSNFIQDGTGKGYLAKIDMTNRLETRSVVEDSTLEGVIDGNSYVIGTPFLTQISGTENGLLYFKFNEDVSLFAKTFSTQARYTTGGAFNNYLINVYKDVDESSLTGTWSNISPLNVNFGSSNQLASVVKYGSPAGAAGFSGAPAFQLGFPINIYNQIQSNLVFPKGVGILLSVVPPTSNTAMPVNFSVTVTKLNYI